MTIGERTGIKTFEIRKFRGLLVECRDTNEIPLKRVSRNREDVFRQFMGSTGILDRCVMGNFMQNWDTNYLLQNQVEEKLWDSDELKYLPMGTFNHKIIHCELFLSKL